MNAERRSYTDADMREAFYNGAQALFTQFTSCSPFPAREMMDAATEAYPEPREFRTVTVNGVDYRYNAGTFEVNIGRRADSPDWTPATAISPASVQGLAKLIDNPFEDA